MSGHDHLVRYLERCIQRGIRDTTPENVAGITLDPGWSGRVITVDEIEEIIETRFCGVERDRLRLLLALGDFRRLPAQQRRQLWAETHEDYRRAGTASWQTTKHRRRTELNLLAASITAGANLSQTEPPMGRPYRVEVSEAFHAFPDKPSGKRVAYYLRAIESRVNNLTEYRTQHSSFWQTDPTPEYRLLTEGELSIVNFRKDSFGRVGGNRFDVIVRFPPMRKGERRVLRFLRELPVHPDDTRVTARPQVLDVQPDQPLGRVTLSVRFAKWAMPQRAWTLTNVRPGDKWLFPPSVGEATEITGDVLQGTWESPAVGFSTGLGWRW
ncbi:hypothetical protein [Microbacterium schleiferi]|uniref:Uncharacterized protein n=1 Tax=Microbacterium schleiferi TaxID=69362 RepID=A0ABU7VAQ0_9MICO